MDCRKEHGMEKIIAAKERWTSDIWRLQCRCLTPDHAIDLEVEKEGGKREPCLTARYTKVAWKSWWERLADMWHILRGQEVHLDDFVFREEDFEPLASLFAEMHEVDILREAGTTANHT
jgi:hypothetical protein